MSGQTKRHGIVGKTGFVVLGDHPTSPPRLNGTVSPNGVQPARGAPDMTGSANYVNGVESPTKAYANANVTPRSGARRARHESVSPQAQKNSNGIKPTQSMPIEHRQAGGANKIRRDVQPFDIPLPSGHHRSGSMSSDGSETYNKPLQLHGRSDTASSAPAANSAPKFFHADDVLQNKPARQGNAETNSRPNSVGTFAPRSMPLKASPMPDEDRSKFFYASEISDKKPLPVPKTHVNIANTRPPMTITSPEPAFSTPQPFRPSSPLKEEILLSSPESSTSSPVESPEQTHGSAPTSKRSSLNQAPSKISRPSSVTSPSESRKAGHSRKSSVTANRARKSSLSNAKPDVENVRSPPMPRRSRLFETQDSSIPNDAPMSPPPLSPVKGQSQLDHLNELAAKARRERKVLDLEISNSSLLAINSTLEREMRKMKSELRHFRRMSRPGRIPSSRLSQRSKHSTGSQDFDSDSAESSGHSSDEEEDDQSSILSHKRQSTSRKVIDESGRIKFKDRAVEPLDLSKQQKQLEDSQGLNQTIRRCLGISESLLTQGKEALSTPASTVGPEILGPRVLSPDEISHAVGERRQGLLTPVLDHNSFNPWERSLAASKVAKTESASPESVEEPPEGDSIDSIDPAIYDAGSENDQLDATPERQVEEFKTPFVESPSPSPARREIGNTTQRELDPDSPSPRPLGVIDPILTTPPRLVQQQGDRETLRKLQGQPATPATSISMEGDTNDMPPPPLPSFPPATDMGLADPNHEMAGKNHADQEKEDITSEATLAKEVEQPAKEVEENKPATRTSVTQYLASFWVGASKLRPP